MTFHPTHGEGGRLVYTREDVREVKALIALTGTGRGGRQGFTDEVLCPERCTRSEGGEPFYDPLRDRDHLIPGDQVLVDVGAYNIDVAPMQWCDVIGLAPGDAAVFPYKVAIPDRGKGQFAAGEIHGWRRPVALHRWLVEYADTQERMENHVRLPETPIEKEEAVAALTAAAFTVHPDNEEALREFAAWVVAMDGPENADGLEERRTVTMTKIVERAREALSETRQVVHSMLGSIGADHDLSHALELVGQAELVAWTSSPFGHDLMVRTPTAVYFYAVPRPERSER